MEEWENDTLFMLLLWVVLGELGGYCVWETGKGASKLSYCRYFESFWLSDLIVWSVCFEDCLG